MRDLANIKVGDRVWVRESIPQHGHRGNLRTVVRVTPTLFILDGDGEFDRYKRSNGMQHAGLTWRDSICDIATPEEAATWDASKAQAKRDKEEATEAKAAQDRKRTGLTQAFRPKSVSINPYGENWNVTFTGLTEAEVRKLAALLYGETLKDSRENLLPRLNPTDEN